MQDGERGYKAIISCWPDRELLIGCIGLLFAAGLALFGTGG
jgi:hypothetical protein